MAKMKVTTRFQTVQRKQEIERRLKEITKTIISPTEMSYWEMKDLKKEHKKLLDEKKGIEIELGHNC